MKSRYNFNEFHSDVAKLGLPRNLKLTTREWRIVRRQIRPKPRRFSKRFLFDELKKRNRFRELVREAQQNPAYAAELGFNISPPIRPGTLVAVYSEGYCSLRRGTILCHDPGRKGYIVQFEGSNPSFSADSEVATAGIPISLSPTTCFPFRDFGNVSFLQRSQYGIDGTSRCDDHGKYNLDLLQDNCARQIRKLTPLNKECERSALLNTVASIDSTIKRKNIILDAIQATNTLVGSHSSDIIKRGTTWLLANLEEANKSLDSSLLHLQVLYGNANPTPKS